MHAKLTTLLATALLALVFSMTARAETVTITSCEWPPYAGEALSGQGFTTELIAAAFERVGMAPEFTFLPWKRALESSADGSYMALYNAYYTEERARQFIYSEPYASGQIVLVAKAGAGINYSTLEDLKPYTIGIARGFAYSPEFDEADYLTKDVADDDATNLRKLLAGRIELMLADKYVVLDLFKNNASIEGTPSDIEFLEPPLAESDIYIVFPRALEGSQTLADAFNEGLRLIKEDGSYDAILARHGFAH